VRIVCDSCRTEFEVELPESFKHRAMKFRCSSCGRTFTTRFEEEEREDTEIEPTGTVTRTPIPQPVESKAPGPGMLLKQEGKVYHVKDTATMQKWIVERRVLREDLVSIGGVRWEPVGSRPELEVFFQVVEQADQAQAIPTGAPPLASVPPSSGTSPPPPLRGPDFSVASNDVTAATEIVERPATSGEPAALSGEDVDDEDSEDTSSGIPVSLPTLPDPQLLATSYQRPEPVDLLQADPEDVLDPFSIDAFPSGLPESDEPTESSGNPLAVPIEAPWKPIDETPFASREVPPRSTSSVFVWGAVAMVALAGGLYVVAQVGSEAPAQQVTAAPVVAPVAPEPPVVAPVVETPPPDVVPTVAPTSEPATVANATLAPTPAEPVKPKDPGPRKPTAKDLQAMIAKAWVAADKSDFVSARKLFAQVQASQPGHAEAAYGLGYTTEKLGDSRESAIRYYCSAQQNVGSNTDLAREIAGRLAELGSDCPP
jgi:predicted Zn finger-like uncharacterized protein